MPKKKKTKNADEEVLKHYTSYDEPPAVPGQDDTKEAPEFIKAKISVDPVLSKRKNAVIKKPPKDKKDKGK